jgi:hypothetical protein
MPRSPVLRLLGTSAANKAPDVGAKLLIPSAWVREQRLLTPRRIPIGRVRIDQTHPLAPDFFVLWTPSGIRSLTGGTVATVNSSFGPDYQAYDGDGDYTTVSQTLAIAGPHSIVCHFSLNDFDNDGSAGTEGIFCRGMWGDANTGDTGLKNNQYDEEVQFFVGTSISCGIPHGAVTLNKPMVVVGTFSRDLYARIYKDGVLSDTSSVGDAMTDYNRAFCIGAYPNGEAETESVISFYSAGVYLRHLNEGEVLSISKDNYQFLVAG